MKKLLALLLVLLMCLSLCACGTGNKNEEKQTENALVETPKQIYDDVKENQAKAMMNTYILKCKVKDITSTYFSTEHNIRVCLPMESLAQLNKDDEVSIIGKITDVITEKSSNGLYSSETTYVILGEAEVFDGEVPEVALREDEIFVGTLTGLSEDGFGHVKIKDTGYVAEIEFADGEDFNSLSLGEEFKFSATPCGIVGKEPDKYTDARIIE